MTATTAKGARITRPAITFGERGSLSPTFGSIGFGAGPATGAWARLVLSIVIVRPPAWRGDR